MTPAQHPPGRPRQCSGNEELATSNSTANRFLGTAWRSWMGTNGASSPNLALPNKPPVSAPRPRVSTNLPAGQANIPAGPAKTQPNQHINDGPPSDQAKHHATEHVKKHPVVLYTEITPVSPITPGTGGLENANNRVNALPLRQEGPAAADPSHRQLVLPSPEPSNGSLPSPTAIPETNHPSRAVAPALSASATSQSVRSENFIPAVPVTCQPEPAPALHNEAPSAKAASSQPSNPHISSQPSAPTKPIVDLSYFWKLASSRLRIMKERSAHQHHLSETVELPRLRSLEDACHSKDLFYLALHQVYCINSFAPSSMQVLGPFNIQPDLGLNVIKQLLVDNQRLSGDFLKWCVSYPSPLMSVLDFQEYRTALSQVARSLSKLAHNWNAYERDLQIRLCPPQVDELVDRLGVISPTLQSIIFTALARRLFGQREPLLRACSAVFERDKANYKNRQTYSPDRRKKEVEGYTLQYRQLGIYHGVFSSHLNSNMPQSNPPITTSAAVPTSISMPVQSPGSAVITTAATRASPLGPNIPPVLNNQQGQRQQQQQQQQRRPHFQQSVQPPVTQHASPSLPMPESSRPTNTPPQYSYPQQRPHHLSNNVQNFPSNQASLQAPPVATPRQDVRPDRASVTTFTNPIPSPQMRSAGNEHHPRRGQIPQGVPAEQTPAGRPVSSAFSGNVPSFPSTSQTGPPAYARPHFVNYGNPHTMTASMPYPVPYGHLALLPSTTMPHMMPVAAPSRFVTGPSTHQSPQASLTPCSPNPSMPQAMVNSSPAMLLNSGTPFPLKVNTKTPSPTLIHYFSEFAMPATKLAPNRSVFKLSFQVPCEALDKRPRLVAQPGSTVLAPCFSDGDVSYRLRCIRCDGQPNIDSLPVWSRAENAWPEVIYIHINDKELRRPHNSKNSPIDINRFLEPGANELRLNILRNPEPRSRHTTYAIAIEVLRFISPTTFQSQVKKLPSQVSLQQVQKRLGVNNDDEELMIMDNFISIDLRDPFTTQIFDTPIRGEACTHRECFDLSTFLQTITFSPPAVGKRTPYLRCPICRKNISPHLLICDEFLLEVRAALASQQKSDKARCIRVKSDGSWEAVLETEDDNIPSSNKLKRSRATFEADLLKTEESRESSLARIPAAVEVIELD